MLEGLLFKVLQSMYQFQNGNSMYSIFLRKRNSGATLVEITIVIAIISVALASLVGIISFSFLSASVQKQSIQALALAQEAAEVVRAYRNGVQWDSNDPANEYDGLGILSPGNSYHPEKSGGSPVQWKMIAGQETIGIFTRSIVFYNVQRNALSGDVGSGVLDPDTKKVVVSVSWSERGRPHSLELPFYITNWQE